LESKIKIISLYIKYYLLERGDKQVNILNNEMPTMAIVNTGFYCLTLSLELLTKSAKSFDIALKKKR